MEGGAAQVKGASHRQNSTPHSSTYRMACTNLDWYSTHANYTLLVHFGWLFVINVALELKKLKSRYIMTGTFYGRYNFG